MWRFQEALTASEVIPVKVKEVVGELSLVGIQVFF
jgi:hypothetical protein